MCVDRSKCIKEVRVCDVTYDCDDGSDQVDCGVIETCTDINCNTGEKESKSRPVSLYNGLQVAFTSFFVLGSKWKIWGFVTVVALLSISVPSILTHVIVEKCTKNHEIHDMNEDFQKQNKKGAAETSSDTEKKSQKSVR